MFKPQPMQVGSMQINSIAISQTGVDVNSIFNLMLTMMLLMIPMRMMSNKSKTVGVKVEKKERPKAMAQPQ
jgi:hypothetical protein